jgi:hypothetical protein
MLYMVGEDFDSAIDWFEIAVEQSNPNVPYVGVNAQNPGFRAHPRFAQLMERMGLDYWASHP